MKTHNLNIAPRLRWLSLAALIASVAWSQSPATRTTARIAISHALPRLDADHLKATLVEVRYGPGESSPAHSHPCPVIGYIIEGAIRTQVKGEPEAMYKAGETFYEAPNGVHAVSANASSTEPARFLAYFVCDHDAPLTTVLPHAGHDKEVAK